MKKALCLVLSFCVFLSLRASDSIQVKSAIQEVTVFRQGAQVLRKAKQLIPAGKATLLFTGITPNIDVQSIQVKAEGDFIILSVSHQVNYMKGPDKSKDIQSLEEEKKLLNEKIEDENTVMQVYNQEESLLVTNKAIGGQQSGVQIQQLKAAADLYRSRLTEIKQKQLSIKRILADYRERLTKIDAQLKSLNAASAAGEYTTEVVVTTDAKVPTNADFTVTYIVTNAGWHPLYDLRVKDVQNPIELAYKANVKQSSGEDWKDVLLTLSTGNPNQSGTRPILRPWYIGNYMPRNANYHVDGIRVRGSRAGVYPGPIMGHVTSVQGRITAEETGEPLIGVSVLVKGTSTGTVTDMNGRYNLPIPNQGSILVFTYVGYSSLEAAVNSNTIDVVLAEGVQLEEMVVTAVQSRTRWKVQRDKREAVAATKPVPVASVQNTTTTEFKIELPYTIPTDNKNYMVGIQQHSLPAEYKYHCVPKLDPDAFLTAYITGWEDYNLLTGKANLFFEGTYIGQSLIQAQSLKDTMEISLGRDKGIAIRRKKVKAYTKRRFLSNKQVITRAWEIEIRNNKKQPIDITIEDQFPVPSKSNIEVEHGEYKPATLDETTGQLTWKLQLSAGKQETLPFRYTVKCPKNHPYIPLE